VPGYSKLRLADVEDSAVAFGYSPNMEFRTLSEPLGLQESGVGYLRLAPGFRMPFGHRHATQEEVYVLVEGSARLRVEDEVLELEAWDVVRVARETRRAFEAGPNGVTLVAFGAPATGPGDAEVLPGWWGDTTDAA
jgi:mannose-6-phosphate isomerase-like protein (cupin superfamily)